MDTQAKADRNFMDRDPDETRVCIIDDDEAIVRLVRRVLEMKGYATLGITNVIGSSNQVRSFRPHVVILDIGLPAISGQNLLDIFRKNLDFSPRVIVFSGMPEEELEALTRQMDVDDFVVKGDGIMELVGKVNDLALQLRKNGLLAGHKHSC